MPRYYHHVRIDGDYFPDVAGGEHLDLSAAHVYAMTLATTLMRYYETADRSESKTPWIVNVENDRGERVLSVIVPYNKCKSFAVEQASRAVSTANRLCNAPKINCLGGPGQSVA
jgi:hypothetical protein